LGSRPAASFALRCGVERLGELSLGHDSKTNRTAQFERVFNVVWKDAAEEYSLSGKSRTVWIYA
jgi:hypothetical protein